MFVRLPPIQRVTASFGRSYDAVVSAFEEELPRWDPRVVKTRGLSWADVEREIAQLAASHGLVILHRIDQGSVTSLTGRPKRCSLYLVGNPVTAERILAIDIRASLYVPVGVCVYDDGDPAGAHLSYDRPSATLRTLSSPALAEVGALLDCQFESVVAAIRSRSGS